jgi:hypothetical protein
MLTAFVAIAIAAVLIGCVLISVTSCRLAAAADREEQAARIETALTTRHPNYGPRARNNPSARREGTR